MILVVTSRKLCKENFFDRIEKIARQKPKGIILREKDLGTNEYKQLAIKCKDICYSYGVPIIINSYIDIAIELDIKDIQVSINLLNENLDKISFFKSVGVSVHSIDEAIIAQNNNATYLIAGHIFNTDCKKGLKARGIEFLNNICNSVNIPVYAIGGINKTNYNIIKCTKAQGVCIMSSAMQSQDLKGLLNY